MDEQAFERLKNLQKIGGKLTYNYITEAFSLKGEGEK